MNLPRYLLIDLSTGIVEKYPVSLDYFRTYLGGKALAARILLDETQPGIDPLSPENVLIINTGPLTGTGAPSSGRFNVTTKNVLTGGIASSNSGGNFGIWLRKAGFDGLVIKGRAEKPIYIEVVDGQAFIQDAAHLWGLDTEETQTKLPAKHGKAVIGPAGENLVRYASIVSQERVAGRCGVGAVMGSKNLKAVTAYGHEPIPMVQPDKFRKLNKAWLKTVQKNILTGQVLPRYGTMGFVSKANVTGLLPVRNFSRSGFAGAEAISGETYAEKHLTKNFGCVACPIRCGRRQLLDGKDIKGPEFETVGLLGSNLDNDSMELIARWNYQADLMGMDTISLGGTLGFAMELKERGLADLGVAFGEFEGIEELIKDIAYRRGTGAELAQGSKWLAAKYGGEEFAQQSKGMEYAAYDPRRSVGLGLGYATANRGACHLNGGYMVFLEVLGPLNVEPQTAKGKAALTILMQNLMEAISTSGLCLFTSMALFPNGLHKLSPSGKLLGAISKVMGASGPLVGWLNNHPGAVPLNLGAVPYSGALKHVTGLPFSLGRFLRLGQVAYNVERAFNAREGVLADTLSRRTTAEPQVPDRPDTVVPLAQMLPEYYRLRGWDEQGVPRPEILRGLGIN